MMKRGLFLLMVLVLAACAEMTGFADKPRQPVPISAFDEIFAPSLTPRRLAEKVGPPGRVIGAHHQVYEYDIREGGVVRVGFDKTLSYAKYYYGQGTPKLLYDREAH